MPPQVRRLAQLSLLAVMRDIVPGYRVRLPTEKELAVPVSKDVQRVRDYESTLLRLYQVRAAPCRAIRGCELCTSHVMAVHGGCNVTGHGRATFGATFGNCRDGKPAGATCCARGCKRLQREAH